MKKFSIIFIVVWAMIAMLGVRTSNAMEEFTIQAEILPANAATFAVSQVEPGQPEVFTPVNTNTLDFGTLTLNDDGIFLPDYYWVIDIGSNGAGKPDVTFIYTDTANPNGALNDGTGLGKHGTIAYSEVVPGPNNTQISNLIRGESLAESNTSGGIDESDIADGFLRVALGIATDDPNLEEGNAEPFTTNDSDGIYSGMLTISATFDQ